MGLTAPKVCSYNGEWGRSIVEFLNGLCFLFTLKRSDAQRVPGAIGYGLGQCWWGYKAFLWPSASLLWRPDLWGNPAAGLNGGES